MRRRKGERKEERKEGRKERKKDETEGKTTRNPYKIGRLKSGLQYTVIHEKRR